ncbi:FHA domain protein [uncultured archaeon]|nr:FHA domain protein [uncultured archaeon]
MKRHILQYTPPKGMSGAVSFDLSRLVREKGTSLLTVGRFRDADIPLVAEDPECLTASRDHAYIQVFPSGQGVAIIDHSSHGTSVAKWGEWDKPQVINPRELYFLSNGDLISFGSFGGFTYAVRGD